MYSKQMWKKMTNFISRPDISYNDLLEKQNLHIAAASLFVHTALADEEFHRKEFNKIKLLIKDRFDYDDILIEHLIAHANRTNNEEMDVSKFIEVINRNLSENKKEDFLGMIWHIIIADGRIHPFEQHLANMLAAHLKINSNKHEQIKNRVLSKEAEYRSDIRELLIENTTIN